MPATTANRGYPYSIPADNNDAAGAIQALAEAIDTDLVSFSPGVQPRRAIRVSRTKPVNFGTTATARDIFWDSVDFNIGNAGQISLGAFSYRVVPLHPGFWMGFGELSFSTVPAISPSITYADLDINTNNVRRGRTSDDDITNDTTNFQTVTLTVGGGYLMNGTTDYFNMGANIERVTAGANVEFFNASMTLWQLTES